MFKWWIPISAGIKCDIQGLDNIARHQTCVIVCNHQSEWETITLCGLLSPIIIVLKKTLLNLPIFGWGLRMVNPIGIDRSSARDSIKQIINQGSERLQRGERVLIFPEGTRKPNTEIKAYSRTASKLAIDNQVAIIPIVHNAGVYWSAGERFKAGRVQMIIGQPIQSDNHTPSSLTRLLQDWTEETYNKITRQVNDEL